MTSKSPRVPPKRQNSGVSTASSGRTVRGSSAGVGTASNRSGIFARLTGSGSRRASLDTEDDEDESEDGDEGNGQDEYFSEKGGRKSRDGKGTPRALEPMDMDMEMEVGINGVDQAGPSDYWRRSPSPPPLTYSSAGPRTAAWRMETSREPWPEDLEHSHADVWVNHDSHDAWAEHGPSQPHHEEQRPGYQVDEAAEEREEAEDDSIGDSGTRTPADDDEREYARRMRDVLNGSGPTAASPAASVLSRDKDDRSDLGAFDSPRSAGSSAKFTGGYDATYRQVVGDKGLGEEEFGALEFPQRDDTSSLTPSTSSLSVRDRVARPTPVKRTVTPYLHPSVSRLRSHVRSASETTQGSLPRGGLHTRTPSHFSQVSLSRSDSTSTLALPHPAPSEHPQDSTPAFSFHPLRHLSAHLFGRRSGRSSPSRPPSSRRVSALGAAQAIVTGEDTTVLGRPSVIDVRGMIAVGTDGGYVVVYGFGQEVNYVLGTDAIAATSGPVTAVTISSDQTYIAVGHATGNIHLYDLSSPTKPARTTAALTLKQVLSGRKEGHLQGSRILHIGFVGARHTSIVSGDEHGRAFWWSLGRVMGVESNDVVRMLGSYPEPGDASSTEGPPSQGYPSRKPSTLFESQPLPLGEKSHPTDTFHFSVLLTPIKLVIVGMKPSARTWYRKMRGDIGGEDGGVVGCAAWLRSGEIGEGSDPVLVYSWGKHLRFLRVRTKLESPVDGGKDQSTEVPEFVEGRRYEAPNPVLALQWYDPNHVLIVTKAEIVLLDVRTLRAVETTTLQTRLLSSNDFYSGLAKSNSTPIPPAIANSVRVHRSKLFLLTQSNVQVGSLQHWNDRILSRVHAGDFLGAIQVALSYYELSAPGNSINLPEDPVERKKVVGTRARELMRASLEWAFSDDRMHDDTHYSADGRGVDLTGLFEGLAASCIEACLSMNDLSFLFDDAYEAYANTGIQRLFLQVLEPYIFDGRIREVPPTIIQGLIAMHDDKGELDLAEAVIWHVEAITLDINQAVTLCEKHNLWDALIHVYTRAMRDYVAPIVKLIGLVYDIQKRRDSRPSLVEGDDLADQQEAFVPEAYKLFSYIEQILSGTSYPSGEALPREEADRARADVYAFLFSDRLAFWPDGPDGQPVLPSEANTPYPYLDLLLRFDTEAFLHSMDIAFEDSYLNDNRAFSRQTIINIMLDIMSREDDDGEETVHHAGDITLLHIFVARNLPKYPQFLFISPSTLHSILVSLAADRDMSTREDRQLAAEYLLSAYTPHDMDDMLVRFESAEFFRILRGAYRRDGRWAPLIEAYVNDPDIGDEVFASLDEIVKKTSKASKRTGGHVPEEVVRAVQGALPSLFDISVRQTALLVDSDVPSLHAAALDALASNEHKQMAYLRCLLEPGSDDGDHDKVPTWPTCSTTPSTNLDTAARHLYVDLVAKHDSSALVPFLDTRGPSFFDLSKLSDQLSANGIYDGQLWALDRAGDTPQAMEAATDVVRSQGVDLAQAIVGDGDEGAAHVPLQTILSTVKMAVRLCGEHSTSGDDKAEDMWYSVLSEVVELNQTVGTLSDGSANGPSASAVAVSEALRGLVQDTLQSLVSSSSSSRLSFPRLFKRLVDDASDESSNGKAKGKAKARKGRAYAEFRTLLSGMLDSYRAESDMLLMTTRLVQDDLFGEVKRMKERRVRGWRPVMSQCEVCHGTLFVVEALKPKSKDAGTGKGKGKEAGAEEQARAGGVVVLGSGGARHAACPPVAVQVSE